MIERLRGREEERKRSTLPARVVSRRTFSVQFLRARTETPRA
jgi:hypothetical protein